MRNILYIKVEPNPGGNAPCYYKNCSNNPDLINKDGSIKTGTLRARIENSFYCKECIPKVYKDLCFQIKRELDPKLWAFK